jgi:arsenate reductase
MEKVIIWHNPRCRKSREGLEYLKGKGIEFEIFEYLKEGFQPEELARIIRNSGQPLKEFIRTNEKEYRELGLKGRELTVEEFAAIASKYPKLLQRPIVVRGNRAVLARPPEKIDEIL